MEHETVHGVVVASCPLSDICSLYPRIIFHNIILPSFGLDLPNDIFPSVFRPVIAKIWNSLIFHYMKFDILAAVKCKCWFSEW
jgi:hypothetical protein